MPENFLIIQTAFVGDVILSTALVEKLRGKFPDAKISMLVRKGNEGLLENNPHLSEVLIWNKSKDKFNNLLKLVSEIRRRKFDHVINLQRFAATGFLTAFSGAKHKSGFRKNPFHFFFSESFDHAIGNGQHEIERNQKLIASLTGDKAAKPRLFPSAADFKSVERFTGNKFYTISPGSVWFTKTLPREKWVELCKRLNGTIYILGSPGEKELGDRIVTETGLSTITNLSGRLSFLESTALMKSAVMNFVNDSAPLHMAGAINAPVTAFYCSTIPALGFGPLSDRSAIIETKETLSCRPCGLHGHAKCPQSHFKCATTIDISQIQLP
ncbi:MAG: glycosyltransferase family 9 protein [Bacteroidia bacterium]